MTATHAVPSDVFDRLAGGGGEIHGVLRDGQRSKRLLLIHELIATTRSRAPQVFAEADTAEAFAVLVDAQRRSRYKVDDVLLQPHVGAWATSCLQVFMSDGEVPPEDIGHLGAIAAAAAVHAGCAFEVTTYIREGSIMFPTFGLAHPGTAAGRCRVRSRAGGGVEIAVAGTTTEVAFETSVDTDARWFPARRLSSSADGVTVDVQLDDVDPFRRCPQLPTMARLSAAEVEDWQAKLDEAWSLLVADHRPRAEAIGAGISSLVPLMPTEVASELSASRHEAIGAVAMTPPQSSLSLALALVHEFQHTKLSALLDLVPLLDRAPEKQFYAPWRPDPRPLRGLLHGTYAFLGLAAFWEVHRRHSGSRDVADDMWAHFELALGRDQVGHALDTLRASGQVLQPGIRFVDGMGQTLSQLRRQPVPALAESSARMASLDLATSWRLRNVRPDPGQVDDWANAWLRERGRPGVSPTRTTVVDGERPAPSSARVALLRHRLAFPDRWREDVGRATQADVLLVEGSTVDAAEMYGKQLAQEPDDLSSWAGLALVLRELPTPATWALTTIPEWVYAVHKAIRERCGTTPEAEELAAWIGGRN